MAVAVKAPAAPAREALAGIGLLIAGMALFSAMDTISKYLAGDYPVVQVVWGRYAFNLLPLLLLLARPPLRRSLATRRPLLQVVRGLLLLLSAAAIILAFARMPLADAIAVTFVTPLLTTALSVPLLGELVGWRRWAAVLCGFGGVLVIVRPGGEGAFGWAALLPLASALAWALGMIATRALAVGESVFATLFYTALVGTLGMTLLLPAVWVAPSAQGWLLMAAMGVLGGLGHLLILRGYARAAASVLAPFAYSQILWATLLGLLVFGDFPDGWTMLGTAIVVASGLYVFWREAAGRAVTAEP